MGDKERYELNITASSEELASDSQKVLRINESKANGRRFVDEEVLPGTSHHRYEGIEAETSTTELIQEDVTAHIIHDERPPMTENNTEATSLNGGLALALYEQGLKSVLTFYVAIGVMSATVFFSRQIVRDTTYANLTWRWAGLIRCVVTVVTTLMALWSKIIINTKEDYLEPVKPENSAFFYTIILVSATLSWVQLLLTEGKNFQLWGDCIVVADILFPVLQMIFIMVSVMLLSDLIFHRIKSTAPRSFYVIYKAASLMVLVNCISCLIFDIFEIEATYLQNYISKNHDSYEIYCFQKNVTGGFFKLSQECRPFLQVFPVILFVSAVGVLLNPIKQFAHERRSSLDESHMLLSEGTCERTPQREMTKHNSLSIICAVLIFVISIIGIPLDMIGLKSGQSNDSLINMQITGTALPMIVLVVVGCASVWLFKLLHDNYVPEHEKKISTVDHFIIWASLCGHLVASFKFIINSSQYIIENQAMSVYILRIIMYCADMGQSLIQCAVLEYINNGRHNFVIGRQPFKMITSSVIILISANLGLFITTLYIFSSQSSFKVYNNQFNIISWGILSCLSDALTLIFRGYTVIFLLRFMSILKGMTTI